MSYDEKFFHYLWRKRSGFRSKKSKPSPASVQLEQVKHELVPFAEMVFGSPVEIKEGSKNAVSDLKTLFLPEKIDVSSSRDRNRVWYYYRILYTQCGLNLIRGQRLPTAVEGNERATSVYCAPLIHQKLGAEYPSFAEWSVDLFQSDSDRLRCESNYSWIESVFLNQTPESRWRSVWDDALGSKHELQNILDDELVSPFPVFWTPLRSPKTDSKIEKDLTDAIPQSLSEGTEKKGRARDEVKNIEVEEDDNPIPITASLEQAKTAEDFKGGKKVIDESDELDDHLEALDELEMKHSVRSPKGAKSIYRADAPIQSVYIDLEDSGYYDLTENSFLYDEWNGKIRNYRRDWCKLTEVVPKKNSDESNLDEWLSASLNSQKKIIQDGQRALQKFLHSLEWKKRQTDGDDIDLDAVIDRYSDLAAGVSPSDRLYQKRSKVIQSLAANLLIDTSLSTDSWVSGRRVLDVEIGTALVLREIFQRLPTRFSISGFHSFSRKNCQYINIKDYEDSWDEGAVRLRNLVPAGYTRIGPALRHATAKIVEQKAKSRVIFLLTDGKPTDYDTYEGRYGQLDVQQAVREARALGVSVFGLAIDSQARVFFPTLFGEGQFCVVPRPELIGPALASIFTKFIAS